MNWLRYLCKLNIPTCQKYNLIMLIVDYYHSFYDHPKLTEDDFISDGESIHTISLSIPMETDKEINRNYDYDHYEYFD